MGIQLNDFPQSIMMVLISVLTRGILCLAMGYFHNNRSTGIPAMLIYVAGIPKVIFSFLGHGGETDFTFFLWICETRY
jgi:hypothetical protein